MNRSNHPKADPLVVAKMIEAQRDELQVDVQKQALDLEIAGLSTQWSEAWKSGDQERADDLERQKLGLLRRRREL